MKTKIVILLLLMVAGLAQKNAIAQNAHFWDGIETFDGPTDKNPILASQIDFYFDRIVAPLPDSITLEISRLIDRTGENTDLRDFILWHLIDKYQHPEYMTQDQVFVWLYDQYFSHLKIKDLNDNNRTLIREKAERLRRLALYSPAPDFRWKGFEGLLSIHSPYTVLFFYDHECNLCQQELRDLDSVAAQHPDIMVVDIDLSTKVPSDNSTQSTNPSELVKISEEYDIEATPLIYVLDSEKRIIAKKIRARQIPMIINHE